MNYLMEEDAMLNKLSTNDLKLITGGLFKGHGFWYYYGAGRASNLASQRLNPTAFLNHPNFMVLGGH